MDNQTLLYLINSENQVVCCLNGVEYDSVIYNNNLMQLSTLSFNVSKYIYIKDLINNLFYDYNSLLISNDGIPIVTNKNNFIYTKNIDINYDAPVTTNKSHYMYMNLNNNIDLISSTYNAVKESDGYNNLKELMYIYLTGIGLFRIENIEEINDGYNEYKTVTCNSCECEFNNINLVSFKVNTGEPSSCEYLAEGNVDVATKLAKDYVIFYNEGNHELSLLHILLESFPYWSIGYVDPILRNKKFSFDINTSSVYSFMMNELSTAGQMIFKFDIKDRVINVYSIERIDAIGDTNICISYRKLLNTVEITKANDGIYTRFNVSGADNLSIEQVNFDEPRVENLLNLLNDVDLEGNLIYANKELVDKYNYWYNYRYGENGKRQEWFNLVKEYNKLILDINNIKYKVAMDALDYNQLETLDEDTLKELKKAYISTVNIMLSDFCQKDEQGNQILNDDGYAIIIDLEGLQNSIYWEDYKLYTTIVIPNVDIALNNLKLSNNDKLPYIDDFLYDWDLYGTVELNNKLKDFQYQLDTLKDSGYNLEWVDVPDKSIYIEANYEIFHQQYMKIFNQYNTCYIALNGSDDKGTVMYKDKDGYYLQRVDNSQYYFNKDWDLIEISPARKGQKLIGRYSELTQLEQKQKDLSILRQNLIDDVSIKNSKFGFTQEQLNAINRLHRDSDYVNENILITSLDDVVTQLDDMNELMDTALNELDIESQPQYSFTATLDNLFSLDEFSQFYNDCAVGNFIHLGITDDLYIALRIVSIQYNPCMPNTNDLQITFTNRLRSKSGLSDYTNLFDSAIESSIGQITSTYIRNFDFSSVILNNDILKALANSSVFSKTFSDIALNTLYSKTGQFDVVLSQYVATDELEARLAKIENLEADSAFIKYLETELIVTSEIFAERVQALSSTVIHSVVDDAYIMDAVINNLSVSDLKAGIITLTDNMYIQSENGGMIMNGSALQIFGYINGESYVGIQLGYDNTNNPSLILRNEKGETVLTPNGITQEAIADELIINDMISPNTITKDRLGFKIVETDENGKVSITEILDGNGDSFGEKYTEFQTSVNNNFNEITETMSGISSVVDTLNKNITNKVWQTDIEKEINDYDETTVKSIRDRVTSNETTITGIVSTVSDMQTDFTDLGQRVTSAESKITQNSNNIELKVSKDEVISSINQSAEKIKIQANKIELEGAVTFSSFDESVQEMINGSQKKYKVLVDLSSVSYSADYYYPIVGTAIPKGGYYNLAVNVQLDSGSKPSWATHKSGFTVNLAVMVKAGGWGTTDANGWIMDNYYLFCDIPPAYFYQMSNSSIPVFYLRGGGKYYLFSDYSVAWNIKVDKYEVSGQSVAPTIVDSSIAASDGRFITTNSGDTIFTSSDFNLANDSRLADLSKWCIQNNRSYIDGGKIYTNTITANQLAANSITAEKIAVDAVTADKINVTTLSSITANVGTLTAGVIRSNNYSYSKGNFSDSGIQIDLTENGSIRSKNFYIDTVGNAYFNGNGKFTGDIVANSLTLGMNVSIAASKVSGLSDVAKTGDYNDLSNKPDSPSLTGYIKVDGTIGSTPSSGSTGFRVSKEGLLTASNAIIYGTIYSSIGKIGGMTLANNYLTSNTNKTTYDSAYDGVFVGTTGIGLGANFRVSSSGVVYAISGTIGGMTLSNNSIYYGTSSMTSTTSGIYLGTTGFRQYRDSTHYVNIQNGVITAYGGVFSGELKGATGSFNKSFVINSSNDSSKINFTVDSDGFVMSYYSDLFEEPYNYDSCIKLNDNIYIGTGLIGSIEINFGRGGVTFTGSNTTGVIFDSCVTFNYDVDFYNSSLITGAVLSSNCDVPLSCLSGHGNDISTALGTIYFKNNSTSHVGRVTCYSSGSNDYAQFGLVGNDNILSNHINIYDNRFTTKGNIELTNGSLYFDIRDHGIKGKVSDNGSGDYLWEMKMGYVGGNGCVYLGDTTIDLRLRGTNIYGIPNAATSDKRLKLDFDTLDKYEDFFDLLKPQSFRMIHGSSGRVHVGFVAQDVEDALNESGISTNDFAGLVKSKPDEQYFNDYYGYLPKEFRNSDEYYLRYEEFIALNTHMIQKLMKRVDELEKYIADNNI